MSMDPALAAILGQLGTLYRSRPYTKVVPFNVTFPGVDPVESAEIWKPSNAYFELAIVVIRASFAGVDLMFAEENNGNPILPVMPPTAEYQVIDINPGYRSLKYSNARLVLIDETTSGVQVKGSVFGYEVDPRGYYR